MNGRFRSPRWALALLALIAVGAAVLTSLALLPRAGTPPLTWNRDHAALSTPEPLSSVPPRTQLSDALPRLSDPARPFNILIFGDSTGISAVGWQVLTAQYLGVRFDRPVELHPWDRDGEEYAASWGLGTGSHAPIVVWNASAPGRDVTYAREHEAAMTPFDPASIDLVFFNFGHTVKLGRMDDEAGEFMVESSIRYGMAAMIYLKQNPNTPGTPLVQTQKANVNQMERWARNQGFGSIAIYEAFQDSGQVAELMDVDSEIHPNAAGYRVWADTMIDRFEEILGT